MEIKHVTGKENIAADVLSRYIEYKTKLNIALIKELRYTSEFRKKLGKIDKGLRRDEKIKKLIAKAFNLHLTMRKGTLFTRSHDGEGW